MLENSASEHVNSVSQRIYQDLPIAKTLEIGSKSRYPVVASIETITAVLTNVAKLGALLSLPVGIVLLNSYLRDEGAPLPAADTSISVLLSLVCVIFLFITLLLASIFLLPTFAKISEPAKSEAPTDSFQYKKKPAIWQRSWRIVGEYYLRFGPFLSFVLFAFISIGLSEKREFQWVGPTIGIVSFISYCTVCYFRRYRKFNNVTQSSGHSLISFLPLFLLLLVAAQQINPQMQAWTVASFCVGVAWIVHFLMIILITDWKKALAFYAAILWVLSWACPHFWHKELRLNIHRRENLSHGVITPEIYPGV